jgi:hypothetical protein
MAEPVEWDDANSDDGNAEEEPEKKTRFQIEFEAKEYGSVDHETLEAMLVGYLVYDKVVEDFDKRLCDTVNADRLISVGLEGRMFENEAIGVMFDELINYYRSERKLPSLEDAKQMAAIAGGTQDDGLMFATSLATCHGAMIARRISLNLLIERFKNHYYAKRVDLLYKDFVRDRGRSGPMDAVGKFRQAVRSELADPEGEVLRGHDFASDEAVNWILDMKRNPDKYRGPTCGIQVIDHRTTGFHPGQLTTFVGRHGGYKTTTLINVAHGLFVNGWDVLYASLEMEARLMQAKLICRHTRQLRWSKMFRGYLSEPDDWGLREAAKKRAMDESLPVEEREKAAEEAARLEEVLDGVEQGKEEIFIAQRAMEDISSRPNKINIVNVGQSKKIKVSQLENWIKERREQWQPSVVIVDYLALVDSDTSHGDAKHEEIGDVCKHFRGMGGQMGFHVATAAQFKRGAIERIRKYGFNNVEKAALGTDDIAGSDQIGADSDTVFMLWPRDGGNVLDVFTPKARHMSDDMKGDKLEVDQDHCTIADDIASTAEMVGKLPMSAAIDSCNRLAPCPRDTFICCTILRVWRSITWFCQSTTRKY